MQGLRLLKWDLYGDYYPSKKTYIESERWLQAAGVMQAIVAVSTIPLVSATCSSAAVVFVQRRCKSGDLSLRQVTVLADKGWTELEIYEQMLCGRRRQYGSRFLYLAIILNLLGMCPTIILAFIL
jgi:hypothetical protein